VDNGIAEAVELAVGMGVVVRTTGVGEAGMAVSVGSDGVGVTVGVGTQAVSKNAIQQIIKKRFISTSYLFELWDVAHQRTRPV
jgi:hypothetical protein